MVSWGSTKIFCCLYENGTFKMCRTRDKDLSRREGIEVPTKTVEEFRNEFTFEMSFRTGLEE